MSPHVETLPVPAVNYEAEKKSDDDNEQSIDDNEERIDDNEHENENPSAMEVDSESLTKSDKVNDSTGQNNSGDAQSKILTIASAGMATVVIASVLIALAIRRKMTGSKTETKNPVQLPENFKNHPVKEETSPITKYFDKASGRWYEHNSKTKATRWLTPEPVEQMV